jgi:hypothetical protein
MEKGTIIIDASGKHGVIVETEYNGGVYRDHCEIWFGEISQSENKIVTEQRLTSTLTKTKSRLYA